MTANSRNVSPGSRTDGGPEQVRKRTVSALARTFITLLVTCSRSILHNNVAPAGISWWCHFWNYVPCRNYVYYRNYYWNYVPCRNYVSAGPDSSLLHCGGSCELCASSSGVSSCGLRCCTSSNRSNSSSPDRGNLPKFFAML